MCRWGRPSPRNPTSWSACSDAPTEGVPTSRGMRRLRLGFPNWRPPKVDSRLPPCIPAHLSQRQSRKASRSMSLSKATLCFDIGPATYRRGVHRAAQACRRVGHRARPCRRGCRPFPPHRRSPRGAVVAPPQVRDPRRHRGSRPKRGPRRVAGAADCSGVHSNTDRHVDDEAATSPQWAGIRDLRARTGLCARTEVGRCRRR